MEGHSVEARGVGSDFIGRTMNLRSTPIGDGFGSGIRGVVNEGLNAVKTVLIPSVARVVENRKRLVKAVKWILGPSV
jgi:hypothetical protein